MRPLRPHTGQVPRILSMVVFDDEETCMFCGDGTHEAPSAPWTCLLGAAPRAQRGGQHCKWL